MYRLYTEPRFITYLYRRLIEINTALERAYLLVEYHTNDWPQKTEPKAKVDKSVVGLIRELSTSHFAI